jgi:hypothetical protein
MPTQQPAYPVVRGVRYDHASAEISVNGTIFVGIESIEWTETLEPGIIRGTRPEKLARTLGEHDAEGSFSMPLEDANALIQGLGNGYMATVFDVVINYSNQGQNNTNVVLVGCRITEAGGSSEAGGDPTMVEFSIDIMRVEVNGLRAVPGMLT